MIVITTPTGQIGRQVVAALLAADEEVRVIARDPTRIPAEVRTRVDVVEGSHDDPTVLDAAFVDADSVFWLVPPDPGADDPVEHYLRFTRPACEAIERRGVDRVVDVSSLGRGWGEDAGLLDAAFAMDERLAQTGVGLRSLAMPYYMENLLGQVEPMRNAGAFFTANDPDRVLASIATRDVAAVAARLLATDSWTGQETVPIVGPDELTPAEMARVISEVVGRTVEPRHVPGPDLAKMMTERGMGEAWARGIVRMTAAQNGGIYDAEAQAAGSRAPTDFRRWCQEVLKPAFDD